MTELQKKRIKYRNKVISLSILRFFLILLPFAVLFAIRWDEYFTPKNGYGVTFSAMIGLVIWILVEKKQAGFLKGFWGISTALIVTYMLQGVLQDVLFFEIAALFGSIATAILNPSIKRFAKLRDAVDTAGVNAEAMGATTLNVKITENVSGRV
jgi:hypothetical protein